MLSEGKCISYFTDYLQVMIDSNISINVAVNLFGEKGLLRVKCGLLDQYNPSVDLGPDGIVRFLKQHQGGRKVSLGQITGAGGSKNKPVVRYHVLVFVRNDSAVIQPAQEISEDTVVVGNQGGGSRGQTPVEQQSHVVDRHLPFE